MSEGLGVDDPDCMSWELLRSLVDAQRRELDRLNEIRVRLSYENTDLKRQLKERGEK